MKRRLLAIVNPASGGSRGRSLDGPLADLARDAAVTIELVRTERAGHARDLAAAAPGAFDGIVVCGGDGTINEIVAGLGGRKLPIAIVPRGTGNALAREIGAPRDPRRWASAIREGRTRERDVGRLSDGRPFVCFLGAGFDGECGRRLVEARRGSVRLGQYLPMITRVMLDSLAASDYTTLGATVDGEPRIEGASWLLLSVSPVYGGPVRFARAARADDGELDLLVLRRRITLGSVTRTLALGALGLAERVKDPTFHRGARFRLACSHGTAVPIQIDGDFAGTLPVDAAVIPGGLVLFDPRNGR